MKINLLSHDNGVGLTQDVRLIRQILSPRHDVTFTDLRRDQFMKADINIFFEILDGRHYDNAKYNLFFPNPEWFWWPKQLAGIDIVLVKTLDAERIFSVFAPKVIYTSFTSEDRLNPEIDKQRVYLHTAGQSETKGTATTFAAWKPEYPQMILTKLKAYNQYAAHGENIMTCFDRLPFDVLVSIQNKCAFHLCCSEYEGFGHYIWEAKSCGGIVITTAAPPMSEMVTNNVDGFLVAAPIRKKMNFARCSIVSREALQTVIEKTIKLSDKKLAEMRTESRRKWEENDKFFRQTLNRVIDTL